MARGDDTALKLVLYGAIGFGIYSLAKSGQLGPDAKAAVDAVKVPSGTAPRSAFSPPVAGEPIRGLCDLGDFCDLVWLDGKIAQNPAVGGRWRYDPSAVFKFMGETVQWLGAKEFVWLSGRRYGRQFTWGLMDE